MDIGIIGNNEISCYYANSLKKAGFNIYDDRNNQEELINRCEIIFICVDTPSLDNGSFNHSHIDSFINIFCDISVKEEKIIIINSTVIPEYCNSVQDSLMNADCNFKLIYSPTIDIQNPSIVLFGYDNYVDENDGTLNKIIGIYDKIYDTNQVVYKKMMLYEAEIAKLAISCYNNSKNSYFNLIGDLIDSKGYNPSIVIDVLNNNQHSFNTDDKALYHYTKNSNIKINNYKINLDNNRQHLDFQFNKLRNSKKPIEFYCDELVAKDSHKLELAIKLANHKKEVIIIGQLSTLKQLEEQYKNLFIYKEQKSSLEQ